MTQEQVEKALDATIEKLGWIDLDGSLFEKEPGREGLEGSSFHAVAAELHKQLEIQNGLL